MAVFVPQDLFGAFGHETRQRIMKTMIELDKPVSPGELADTLEVPLSNISYHVRKLRIFGGIQLVAEEAVRGSVKHLYEVPEEVERLPWLLELLLSNRPTVGEGTTTTPPMGGGAADE